ncbi:protein of unknown function [Streptomyces sp. DvalAA-14]|uniref:DUF5133 domain-containing protein n=1 Tax=unclassified Streptomyces TaxID=2593676 RepID=UPI00081B32D8|nr:MULTISPECIES: DUF5133 domain-containing protein [unclassified Streptomyces]MYS23439.1 DUF5133 domain-containing protein [Streptomyces sp. SID4948]SCE33268.1 protein of unknown function [Streptomyces sp. DvalAA-14]
MLMAHPTVLRTLVERYEALRALADQYGAEGVEVGGGVDPRIRQQLQDTVYTLCVSTGTREIGPALAAARDHMERSAFAADDVAPAHREAA